MARDLSLYIHIPFCKKICLYCNFLTFAGKEQWIPGYVEKLCEEIEKRARHHAEYQIETIYFGGGTPSLIAPELIKKIIQRIRACFKLKNNIEISIECNPESVDKRRLEIYKEAGVTRFSLGVQSLSKKTLQRVARPHDSKTIFKALEHFKTAGITNFGTDFIMGLPCQTLASFKKEVATILTYHPAHLSYYFLSYDTKKIDLFIKECPDEDEQIAMYEWLCKELKRHKFVHYEVSNWALPGHECAHNKRYWEQKDYLGIGLGAHSIVNGTMWENPKFIDDYMRDPLTMHEVMPIDADLKRMEHIMLRLRTRAGLNLRTYRMLGDAVKLLKNAETYLHTGHLKKRGNALAATEKGFLILEKITQSLL